jgi:hypothetical protein
MVKVEQIAMSGWLTPIILVGRLRLGGSGFEASLRE